MLPREEIWKSDTRKDCVRSHRVYAQAVSGMLVGVDA